MATPNLERLLFTATALYDFGGDESRTDVLSFSCGENFEIWDNSGEHYWYAKIPSSGAYGYVPASYLKVNSVDGEDTGPRPKRVSLPEMGGVLLLPLPASNFKMSKSLQNLDEYTTESQGQGGENGAEIIVKKTDVRRAPSITESTLRINKMHMQTKAEENNTWQRELERKKLEKEKAAGTPAASSELQDKLAKFAKKT
eukprot:Opistho-2@17527